MLTTAAWKQRLTEGACDNELQMLYGKEAVPAQRSRRIALLDTFRKAFGEKEVILISTPGRSEIGGNHTDHQGGRVLAASVSLDVLAVASPNGTDEIRLRSAGYSPVTIRLDTLEPQPKEKNTSASLSRGVAARLTQLGANVGGFDAVIESDVPRGSGLSSSAAYTVLIGSIINTLFAGGKFSPADIAIAAKFAENNFFGKPSGLLDQLACASGGFTMMDFKVADAPVVERIDCDFDAMGLVVFIQNAGGSHANLTPEYAAVPQEMRTVAAALGKTILSEVSPDTFYQNAAKIRGKVGDRAILRAMHFYAEDARVPFEGAALRNQDTERFLELVRESGKSSFEVLQNVCPSDSAERSVALAIAWSEKLLNGKGATRVHGGGFAGTIQAFVPKELAETYQSEMEAMFGKDTCYRLRVRPVGAYCMKEH